jgi:1,4-dihydroxy-6-naphthoate synthase
LWSAAAPPADMVVVPFDQITTEVARGRFDAGLVVDEARSGYPYGLAPVADLGEWWEAETGLPVPFGALMANRRHIRSEVATEWVRDSLRHARDHPTASHEHIRTHARQTAPAVVARQIAHYVNEYTEDLGVTGRRAVLTLLTRAADAHLVPPTPPL